MHHLKSPRFNKTQSFIHKVTYLGFKKVIKYQKYIIGLIHRIINIYHMQAVLAQGKIQTIVLLKSLKWRIEWKINLIFRWILIVIRQFNKREISHLLLYLLIKNLTRIKADNKDQSHRELLLKCLLLHFKSLPANLLMERWEKIYSGHISKISYTNNQNSWIVLTQHLMAYHLI